MHREFGNCVMAEIEFAAKFSAWYGYYGKIRQCASRVYGTLNRTIIVGAIPKWSPGIPGFDCEDGPARGWLLHARLGNLANTTFVVNVEAVIHRDGKLLTIVRAEAEDFGAGWLCFPGGTVDWTGDEQDVFERTATREVFEEVGLDVPGPWHLVENHTFSVDSPALDVVMLAQSDDGEPFAKSPDEVAELAWMTPTEILADPRAQPFTRYTVQRCMTLIDDLGW